MLSWSLVGVKGLKKSFQDLLVGESTTTTTENRVITVSLYF